MAHSRQWQCHVHFHLHPGHFSEPDGWCLISLLYAEGYLESQKEGRPIKTTKRCNKFHIDNLKSNWSYQTIQIPKALGARVLQTCPGHSASYRQGMFLRHQERLLFLQESNLTVNTWHPCVRVSPSVLPGEWAALQRKWLLPTLINSATPNCSKTSEQHPFFYTWTSHRWVVFYLSKGDPPPADTTSGTSSKPPLEFCWQS